MSYAATLDSPSIDLKELVMRAKAVISLVGSAQNYNRPGLKNRLDEIQKVGSSSAQNHWVDWVDWVNWVNWVASTSL